LCSTELAETKSQISEVWEDISINTWFTGTFYLGNHYAANSMALFEYCDLYQTFSSFNSFFPEEYADWQTYDVAGASQTLTRFIAVASIDLPDIKKLKKEAEAEGDALAKGALNGEIFSLLFSFQIAPIATQIME
jgi:hypothetical protein